MTTDAMDAQHLYHHYHHNEYGILYSYVFVYASCMDSISIFEHNMCPYYNLVYIFLSIQHFRFIVYEPSLYKYSFYPVDRQ